MDAHSLLPGYPRPHWINPSTPKRNYLSVVFCLRTGDLCADCHDDVQNVEIRLILPQFGMSIVDLNLNISVITEFCCGVPQYLEDRVQLVVASKVQTPKSWFSSSFGYGTRTSESPLDA